MACNRSINIHSLYRKSETLLPQTVYEEEKFPSQPMNGFQLAFGFGKLVISIQTLPDRDFWPTLYMVEEMRNSLFRVIQKVPHKIKELIEGMK